MSRIFIMIGVLFLMCLGCIKSGCAEGGTIEETYVGWDPALSVTNTLVGLNMSVGT